MPRISLPVLAVLALVPSLGQAAAQVQQTRPIDPALYSVRVTTAGASGGVGVGVGTSYLNVACDGNTPVLGFPKSAPRPHLTRQAGPHSAASVIVSRVRVVRAIMKRETAITANLNPLELQFSCQNKQVVVQGGRLVNIVQR